LKVLTLAALALAAFVALAAPAAAASKKPKTQYYLSLGDSLSVGIQPGPADDPGHEAESVETNDGYTEQLFTKAKRLYPGLKLVKAGCSGATTENFLRGGINVTGLGTCTPPQPLYKSTSAATSQMAYAQKFIRDHEGQIAFITVSIGNNDLDTCRQGSAINFDCVAAGQQSVGRNVAVIGRRLRRAAGPDVPIIGTTFYDPYLGLYLQGGVNQALAQATQTIAQEINAQTLAPAWKKSKVAVARIDDAFGTYIPFNQMVNDPTWGMVPVAVADVCNYSWFCVPPPAGPNIHANKTGYSIIAGAFFTQLKKVAS
jgi:hypothetical protein